MRRAAVNFKYLSSEQLAKLPAAVAEPAPACGRQRLKRLRDRLMLELMAQHGLLRPCGRHGKKEFGAGDSGEGGVRRGC